MCKCDFCPEAVANGDGYKCNYYSHGACQDAIARMEIDMEKWSRNIGGRKDEK